MNEYCVSIIFNLLMIPLFGVNEEVFFDVMDIAMLLMGSCQTIKDHMIWKELNMNSENNIDENCQIVVNAVRDNVFLNKGIDTDNIGWKVLGYRHECDISAQHNSKELIEAIWINYSYRYSYYHHLWGEHNESESDDEESEHDTESDQDTVDTENESTQAGSDDESDAATGNSENQVGFITGFDETTRTVICDMQSQHQADIIVFNDACEISVTISFGDYLNRKIFTREHEYILHANKHVINNDIFRYDMTLCFWYLDINYWKLINLESIKFINKQKFITFIYTDSNDVEDLKNADEMQIIRFKEFRVYDEFRIYYRSNGFYIDTQFDYSNIKVGNDDGVLHKLHIQIEIDIDAEEERGWDTNFINVIRLPTYWGNNPLRKIESVTISMELNMEETDFDGIKNLAINIRHQLVVLTQYVESWNLDLRIIGNADEDDELSPQIESIFWDFNVDNSKKDDDSRSEDTSEKDYEFPRDIAVDDDDSKTEASGVEDTFVKNKHENNQHNSNDKSKSETHNTYFINTFIFFCAIYSILN